MPGNETKRERLEEYIRELWTSRKVTYMERLTRSIARIYNWQLDINTISVYLENSKSPSLTLSYIYPIKRRFACGKISCRSHADPPRHRLTAATGQAFSIRLPVQVPFVRHRAWDESSVGASLKLFLGTHTTGTHVKVLRDIL